MSIRVSLPSEAEREVLRHQGRLRASTTGGVKEQPHRDFLNRAPTSREVTAPEVCPHCGRPMPNPEPSESA